MVKVFQRRHRVVEGLPCHRPLASDEAVPDIESHPIRM